MVEGDLTERELLVARKAAELAADMAVQKMTDEFYRTVGKSVINRWLVLLGAAAVAFAVGKGWIPWRS